MQPHSFFSLIMLQEFSHPPFTVIKCDNQTLLFVTLLDVEMDQDGDMICKSWNSAHGKKRHTHPLHNVWYANYQHISLILKLIVWFVNRILCFPLFSHLILILQTSSKVSWFLLQRNVFVILLLCVHTQTWTRTLTQEWVFSVLSQGVFLSVTFERQWRLIVVRQGVISTLSSACTSLCKGQFKVLREAERGVDWNWKQKESIIC